MAKKLNFSRLSKEKYALKFEKEFSSMDWSSSSKEKELMTLAINVMLIEMITEEVKGVLVPQLKEMCTSINSDAITTQIIEKVNNNFIIQETNNANEHYTKVSNDIFIAIEKIGPTLLGQLDTCGWLEDY